MMHPQSDDVLVISTDGSTLNNGRPNAAAGHGGYFGENDPRNFGLPNGNYPQTNNSAELLAIREALRRSHITQNVRIRTDSMISKDALEGGYEMQKIAAFKRAEGVEIVNEDIIRDIKELTKRREAYSATTQYTWVRGHRGDVGNEAADKLAKEGAKLQQFQWRKYTPYLLRAKIEREEKARRLKQRERTLAKKLVKEQMERLNQIMQKNGVSDQEWARYQTEINIKVDELLRAKAEADEEQDTEAKDKKEQNATKLNPKQQAKANRANRARR